MVKSNGRIYVRAVYRLFNSFRPIQPNERIYSFHIPLNFCFYLQNIHNGTEDLILFNERIKYNIEYIGCDEKSLAKKMKQKEIIKY